MSGFGATTILFPYGIFARLPSPGMHGAALVVLHAGGSFPPPINQSPVPGSSVAVVAQDKVRRRSMVITKPEGKGKFWRYLPLVLNKRRPTGKLKSKFCAAK